MSARDPDELRRQFNDDYESVRKQFRDDYEFAVGPLRDNVRANYEGALKFADSGIRTLFSLNGGGLIALPAFAALFKTDMHTAAVWIVSAMVAFVIGLTSAALTSLFGYMSAMKSVEATHSLLSATGAKYARHYQQAPETTTIGDEIKASEEAAGQYTTRSIRLRTLAVAVSIFSLLAFIVGACLAARALAA
jgi:hypothetical protein